MNIGLPPQNEAADSRFGRGNYFTIFSMDENRELFHKEPVPYIEDPTKSIRLSYRTDTGRLSHRAGMHTLRIQPGSRGKHGLQLVSMLTEQLGGTMDTQNNKVTTVRTASVTDR